MEVNIVWFKKDLRLEDNKPLFLAYNDNLPTILLYIIEPKLWKQEDVSFRQFTFLRQCLQDLKKKCQIYDLYFNILTGETLEIFNYLTTKFTIKKSIPTKKLVIIGLIIEIKKLENGAKQKT